jgi:hypothetical protein
MKIVTNTDEALEVLVFYLGQLVSFPAFANAQTVNFLKSVICIPSYPC